MSEIKVSSSSLNSFAPKTRLKIALDARYVQDHFPGIGRYTFSLAEALAQLPDGPDLTLIYNPALPDSSYNIRQLAENYPDRVRLLNTSARPFSPNEQWQLFRPVQAAKVKLWHAPYYIRPYLLPTPSVLTFHDLIALRVPDAVPSRKARFMVNVTTRLAVLSSQKIIAVSRSAAEDLQHFYGVSPKKISVVLHGVSSRFKPLLPPEQAEIRARLNLPANYLLYIGINKPHKNQARLLEAFKLYKERTGDTERKLVLAGRADPRYTPQLLSLTEKLNLVDDVKFWHNVPESDITGLYACAELFVLPSLLEGFGLPILEAMASGVPVICANNSSLPEVAGPAGLYFDALDISQMSARIEEALHKKQELREKGLAQVAGFTWQRVAEQTLEVYHSVK